MRLLLSLFGLALLVGCAPQPGNIKTQEVPYAKFVFYTCAELSDKSFELSDRGVELYHELKTTAERDKAQVFPGTALVVPIFFLDSGRTRETVEFARLKGEYDTIKDLMEVRKCAAQGYATAPAIEDIVGDFYGSQRRLGERHRDR